MSYLPDGDDKSEDVENDIGENSLLLGDRSEGKLEGSEKLRSDSEDSPPPTPASGSSSEKTGRVHVHGLADPPDSRSDSVTPVEDDQPPRQKSKMSKKGITFDVGPEEGEEDVPLTENGAGAGPPAKKKQSLFESQSGVVELSTLITNPGLKRAESADFLNLTLHQCARDGIFDNMKKLLQSLTGNVKKKVNSPDEENFSALHYAARYNHYKLVKLLIEFGANPNISDEEGSTPLHFAAKYKRMRLAQFEGEEEAENTEGISTEDGSKFESTVENSVILYLVDRGAGVNAVDIYGCTPLHFAAMRGNEIATKELLSCRGVNIEAVDKQQMTALHCAASHNEVEVCRMLIELGANLRCCDEDRATPLHYACQEGSEQVVKMLFEAGEKQDGWVTVQLMVADDDNQQNTPLHLAVENSSYEVSKLTIDKGADVNAPRSNYQTALHLAAVNGDVKILKLLCDHNARIDALDASQSTPLHKAAGYNHAEAVEFLLDKGARIDKHDKDNFTPLLLAACNGHAKSMKALLSHGADIFTVDKHDKSALYWTAEEDNLQAMQLLLEHPKCVELLDMTDRYDNTPLHIAAEKGYVRCVRALLDADADMDAKNEEEQTPLHLAAKNGKTNVVRELVGRNKTVINDEDEDTNTPLHLACLAGHNKAVKELITAGADIEARNCSLWTPLDCAAARGWHKTVKVLLEADSPVDPMDKTKTTPLHLACSRGHLSVTRELLNWKASVSQRDHDGNNCLDLAVDNGHKDVASAIVTSDRWKEALSNEMLDLNTGLRVTPMRKLIKKMPDVAEKAFMQCTSQSSANPDQLNYKITFNYEFLDDMYANWRDIETSDSMSTIESIYDEDNNLLADAKPYTTDSAVLKNNHPLMLMVRTNQEDLLAHPLVGSLLRHKWRSFGRYVYYTNLSIYCVFLTFLTGYILTTDPPYMLKEKYEDNYNLTSDRNDNQFCEDVRIASGNDIDQHWFAKIGKYIIMGLAGFNILREMFQFYNARLNYLGWENLIEWITYISALLLVIDFSSCQEATGVRFDWQWQLAALSVFLAWIDLVLFIRKLPLFGIYVVMFTDILYTFVQFFPVFCLFIIAFALAFFVLFQNQYEFRGFHYSLIKTAVMMIGEFEYGDIFLKLEDGSENDPYEHRNTIYYEIISYLLFVTFMILMAILIMNLLVGLAVDDIKAVQEQAVLKRLAMQVELALDVESIVPQFLRRRFVVKEETIFPNAGSSNKIRHFFTSSSSFMSTGSITKALNPELDEWEVLQENQEKMKDMISNLRGRVKAMDQQNQQLNAMLTAIMRHHKIEMEDEDFQETEAL